MLSIDGQVDGDLTSARTLEAIPSAPPPPPVPSSDPSLLASAHLEQHVPRPRSTSRTHSHSHSDHHQQRSPPHDASASRPSVPTSLPTPPIDPIDDSDGGSPPHGGKPVDRDDIFALAPHDALRLLCRGIEALVRVTGDVPPTPPMPLLSPASTTADDDGAGSSPLPVAHSRRGTDRGTGSDESSTGTVVVSRPARGGGEDERTNYGVLGEAKSSFASSSSASSSEQASVVVVAPSSSSSSAAIVPSASTTSVRGIRAEKEVLALARRDSEKSLARLRALTAASGAGGGSRQGSRQASRAGSTNPSRSGTPKMPVSQPEQQQQEPQSSSFSGASGTPHEPIDGVKLREEATPTQQPERQQQQQWGEGESDAQPSWPSSPPAPPASTVLRPYVVIGANSQPLNMQHGAITRKFYSRSPPPISIAAYLERMYAFCPMSTAVYLACSLYIHRLAVDEGAIPVTPRNAHRLLLAGLRVAMKALEDLSYPHGKMAKVGGVGTGELARLEVNFCFLTGFELVVDERMLRTHLRALREGRGWRTLVEMQEVARGVDECGLGGLELKIERKASKRGG